MVRNSTAARTIRHARLSEVTTVRDGETLDVPGNPTVLHVPGHTPGSVAYYFPDRRLLFSGDAIVTRHMVTGRTGPQLSARPFNTDTRLALGSLTALERLDVGTLLPGHGAPWTGGTEEAVARARSGAEA